MTQLAAGEVRAEAMAMSGSDGIVYHARVWAPSASTFAVLEADYAGVVIPLSWKGRFVINGVEVRRSAIYTPVDGSIFQIHGGDRETVAVAMPREDLAATIAALKGIDPDEERFGGGPIEVCPAAFARLRSLVGSSLGAQFVAERSGDAFRADHESFRRSVVEAVTDLYLRASPAPRRRIRSQVKLGRIVRRAEECFEAAQSGPVSLADLCAAAGVSQGTLYHAFMLMCGDSPMAHFKKRRLTNARLALLGGAPTRGLVKIAALDAGLTHLGRFSAEYSALFGESPSTTLNRSLG